MAELVESRFDYRLFAVRIPANACYAERLIVFAMPGETDARAEIAGHLVVYAESVSPPLTDRIDWIEVGHAHQRHGLGCRLWNAAQNILGRALLHDPVTKPGMKFARRCGGPFIQRSL
jgi:hypothetical protein